MPTRDDHDRVEKLIAVFEQLDKPIRDLISTVAQSNRETQRLRTYVAVLVCLVVAEGVLGWLNLAKVNDIVTATQQNRAAVVQAKTESRDVDSAIIDSIKETHPEIGSKLELRTFCIRTGTTAGAK